MSNAFEIQEQPGPAPTTQPPAGAAQTPPNAPADPNADLALEPNASPYNKFMAGVRKLGRESALGKDSLPNLAGLVSVAVSTGALDPKQKEKDDAGVEVPIHEHIFNVYTKEEGKKALHDRTGLSKRSQISKIKQIIIASNKPNVSFPGVLERARTQLRPKLQASGGKLKSPFDAYVSLARAQKEKDQDLTDAEIEAAMVRSEAEENTVEKELMRMHKRMKKLLTGDGKNGVKIEQTSEIYQDMQVVQSTLLEAVRTFNSEYDVPKPEPKKEGEGSSTEGQASAAPANGEAQAPAPEVPQQPAGEPTWGAGGDPAVQQGETQQPA